MYRIIAVAAALACLLAVSRARSQDGPAALPEGPGLAAGYPGDNGIAQDPAVVFAEDFEVDSPSEFRARWQDISNKDGKVLALVADIPDGSSGTRSLQMTATRGQNSGDTCSRSCARATTACSCASTSGSATRTASTIIS